MKASVPASVIASFSLILAACSPGALAPTGGGAAGSSGAAPIEIGVAAGITGYLAAVDGPTAEGIQLAANTLNGSGGVDGHQLNVHVVDMASVAATGVTAVNQLLNQYNANVIMTGSSSAGTAAETPIVTSRQVPLIVNTVLPPDTDPKWVFSVLPLIDHIVGAELNYASKNVKAESIAFMYSQTPYGQQGSAIAAASGPQMGMSVPVNLGVDATATDVSPLLAQARDANTSAVVTLLTGPIQLVVAKNATSLGLKVPLIMATDDPGVLQAASAGYANAFTLVSAPMAYPDISSAKRKAAVQAFRTEWDKTHKDLTGAVGAQAGWDEVQLLATAIKSSHATGGDALRAALEAAAISGTSTDYQYSAADHTGQQKVAIPFAVGQFQGSTLNIVSPFAE
ncbi:MAG: ABC transporter substrate-binding protein [Chloroflexi bacterium]|nr:ABC transporter substrate-binding protein [Chloroflexota bacterium]